MSFPQLSANDRENILRNNWWGHDGRWYLFVSKEFGFEKANEMNMAINKAVGKLEMKNYMDVSKIDEEYIKRDLVQNLKLNLELCAQDVFTIMDFYDEDNHFILKISRCAAHFGTQKADYMRNYKCACFKRIEGWFDAIGVNATVLIQKSLVNDDKFCEIIIRPDTEKFKETLRKC
ncbi:MAG: hypothetical protein JRJ39_11950 [Deltaproteobacteria bacterium]|nr:hypothetical protein [Deltaproteobacteria bacterium]MBW1814347.1 hypothetical protein [Deltaproteobacteria bacterium]MBW1847256.1 hypothetical protein [Deltaproteobacteria bacterium]MBW1983699.1 hypothetical protein [Deltaproteobacteria bacterium]MBW2181291.1 hypothetical protein [Deltaproteobacteria bacterium]